MLAPAVLLGMGVVVVLVGFISVQWLVAGPA